MVSLLTLSVSVFSLALCLVAWKAVSRRKLRLPPGPKPLPLLGNMFDMPVEYEYKTYTEWSEKYGDVVYVTALGNHIIILSSVDAAKELLETRSAIHSDRPYIPMIHEPTLIDSNHSFVFKPYNSDWRRQRRLFTQHLNPTASRTHFAAQTSAAHTLLRSLLESPEQLVAHLRHTAAESILAMAYGYQIQPKNDPVVALAEHVVKVVSDGVLVSRFWVNFFPWLKYIPEWVPGAGFKKYARDAREAERKLVFQTFEDAERRIAAGTALPSFVASALSDISPADSVTDIRIVAETMFGAAADTTVSSMQSCILALVLYPAVQQHAQMELDAVLGPPSSPAFRLPTFEDRPHLPYIDAIVKESLRWLPVGPLGVPHAASEHDVYRGWDIPKGTILMANAWSMLRDEKTYPDPLQFQPERYLGDKPAPHPGSQGCFGFGRRECPGRHLAEASLWIQIANILAALTISPAKDEAGRDIDVTYAREPPPGFVVHPQHFPCTIKPRSKEAEMRIHETRP